METDAVRNFRLNSKKDYFSKLEVKKPVLIWNAFSALMKQKRPSWCLACSWAVQFVWGSVAITSLQGVSSGSSSIPTRGRVSAVCRRVSVRAAGTPREGNAAEGGARSSTHRT